MNSSRPSISMSILSSRTARIALAASFLCFARTPSKAVSSLDAFIGTWKEDESRASNTPPIIFIRDEGGNLQEIRGQGVAGPLLQAVHFDGKPYPNFGPRATCAWKRIGKNDFERDSFTDGKLALTRRMHLSDDGQTMTVNVERTSFDGTRMIRTSKYQRASGETAKDLAGFWKTMSYHSATPLQMKFEETNHLLKMTDNWGSAYTAGLDGKPAAITAWFMLPEMTIALTQLDARTLEYTLTREGVSNGKSTLAVSPDGKVLTVTYTFSAPSKFEPNVTVYEKQ